MSSSSNAAFDVTKIISQIKHMFWGALSGLGQCTTKEQCLVHLGELMDLGLFPYLMGGEKLYYLKKNTGNYEKPVDVAKIKEDDAGSLGRYLDKIAQMGEFEILTSISDEDLTVQAKKVNNFEKLYCSVSYDVERSNPENLLKFMNAVESEVVKNDPNYYMQLVALFQILIRIADLSKVDSDLGKRIILFPGLFAIFSNFCKDEPTVKVEFLRILQEILPISMGNGSINESNKSSLKIAFKVLGKDIASGLASVGQVVPNQPPFVMEVYNSLYQEQQVVMPDYTPNVNSNGMYQAPQNNITVTPNLANYQTISHLGAQVKLNAPTLGVGGVPFNPSSITGLPSNPVYVHGNSPSVASSSSSQSYSENYDPSKPLSWTNCLWSRIVVGRGSKSNTALGYIKGDLEEIAKASPGYSKKNVTGKGRDELVQYLHSVRYKPSAVSPSVTHNYAVNASSTIPPYTNVGQTYVSVQPNSAFQNVPPLPGVQYQVPNPQPVVYQPPVQYQQPGPVQYQVPNPQPVVYQQPGQVQYQPPAQVQYSQVQPAQVQYQPNQQVFNPNLPNITPSTKTSLVISPPTTIPTVDESGSENDDDDDDKPAESGNESDILSVNEDESGNESGN